MAVRLCMPRANPDVVEFVDILPVYMPEPPPDQEWAGVRQSGPDPSGTLPEE